MKRSGKEKAAIDAAIEVTRWWKERERLFEVLEKGPPLDDSTRVQLDLDDAEMRLHGSHMVLEEALRRLRAAGGT